LQNENGQNLLQIKGSATHLTCAPSSEIAT
jgi:hypothetical protein